MKMKTLEESLARQIRALEKKQTTRMDDPKIFSSIHRVTNRVELCGTKTEQAEEKEKQKEEAEEEEEET